MAELLKSIEKPQVSPPGVFDLVGMLVAKRIVDAVSMPLVGNNNIVSGVSKLVLGGVAHNKLGRLGNLGSGGLILDGADDLAGVVMGKLNIGRGGGQAQAAVNPGL